MIAKKEKEITPLHIFWSRINKQITHIIQPFKNIPLSHASNLN